MLEPQHITSYEIAKRYGICKRVVNARAKRLNIPKELNNGRWGYIFNVTDEFKIVNYRPIATERPQHKVEVIRIETTYYIYESKLNYMEV